MRSLSAQISEPTGAPSPFDRQNDTVSKCRAYSAAGMPVATTALKRRAPSKCMAMPRAPATFRIAVSVSRG